MLLLAFGTTTLFCMIIGAVIGMIYGGIVKYNRRRNQPPKNDRL